MDYRENPGSEPVERATRCQLLWAVLFVVVTGVLGWWLVARLLF